MRTLSMAIRHAVAWWLERAADRRQAEGHRIYREAERLGIKLGGSVQEINFEFRDRFNRELNAASTLRAAAEALRRRA